MAGGTQNGRLNMLPVVSLQGADELQIVRIMAVQILSFAIVLSIHTYRT